MSSARDQRIILMREIGCGIADISTAVGASPATVNRVLKKHGSSKGTLSAEVIDKARADLLNSTTSDQGLQNLAASTIRNNLSITDRIQAQTVVVLDRLEKDTKATPLTTARTLTALANANKLSVNSIKDAKALVDEAPFDPDDLPSISFSEMTGSDVRELRRIQEEEEAITLGLPIPDDEPEIEVME